MLGPAKYIPRLSFFASPSSIALGNIRQLSILLLQQTNGCPSLPTMRIAPAVDLWLLVVSTDCLKDKARSKERRDAVFK
jgi:hypothetical protein